MRFTRHRKGIRADVDPVEAQVLGQLAREMLEVVPAPELSDDPLAALVGLSTVDVEQPSEPVLRRLLPDAYLDDADASGDFRRYTDADLRAAKRRDAQAVLDTLPSGKGRLEIDRDQADRWLGALNDMRLALGTSLGVTEDDDEEEPDPDRAQARGIYDWLGYLQESLLSCLDPRPGG
jgi:hypothetical protein